MSAFYLFYNSVYNKNSSKLTTEKPSFPPMCGQLEFGSVAFHEKYMQSCMQAVFVCEAGWAQILKLEEKIRRDIAVCNLNPEALLQLERACKVQPTDVKVAANPNPEATGMASGTKAVGQAMAGVDPTKGMQARSSYASACSLSPKFASPL